MKDGLPDTPLVPPVPTEPELEPLDVLPGELLWLFDAPMFIDEEQVQAFYDAVLRPDYEGVSLTLEGTVAKGATFEGGLGVEAGLPWLGKADIDLKGGVEWSRTRGRQATLRVVSNAYRHLVALSVHYVARNPNRVVLAYPAENRYEDAKRAQLADVWTTDAFIVDEIPRALVFLDLPVGTKFIPTALELNGKVSLLFEDLGTKLGLSRGSQAPKYPHTEEHVRTRAEYWKWFADNFDSTIAMEVIEKAAETSAGEEAAIAWIDYRVPLDIAGQTFLHLHVRAREQYPIGAFAYNLVKRGSKHGMRLIGTLKSEPDLNVLAIFER